jgi:TonB-like protein
MFRLLSAIGTAILAIAFASAQDDTGSQFPSQDVRALLAKLQNASVQDLNRWVKHPNEIGSVADPFCLTRERLVLVDLVTASLVERNPSIDEAKKAAEVQKQWDTYLLMTFRPAERKQLTEALDKVEEYFSKGGSLVPVSIIAVPPTQELRDAQRQLLAAPVPDVIDLPPLPPKCHLLYGDGSVPEALRRGSSTIHWNSNVALLIGSDGSVMQAETGKQGNAAWDKAAVDLVRHWKFRPFYLAGSPVKVRTTISIMF